MRRKLLFAGALALIVLISWADVHYAGAERTEHVPDKLRQVIHVAALLLTALTGFVAWQPYPERWLRFLWLAGYGLVFALTLGTYALYLLHLPPGNFFTGLIFNIRNIFIGPFPLLVFYMLLLLSRYRMPKT
jgi:hypothetical protein